MPTACDCVACEAGLGEVLTRLIKSFGADESKLKLASSYGIEIDDSELESHCEIFEIEDFDLDDQIGDKSKHTAIDLRELTPSNWGLSLDRGDEAVEFLQNQLFAMCLLQTELCKSQQIDYLTGKTKIQPSRSQFMILNGLLRDLDRYSGLSLNAHQAKAIAIALRTQLELNQSLELPENVDRN